MVIEKTKNECAQKFFAEINRKIGPEEVKYAVVADRRKMMAIVNRRGMQQPFTLTKQRKAKRAKR
jgi:hypothetical protein